MDSSIIESGQYHCSKYGSVKNQNKMANCVDPDKMAYYEQSHQDLQLFAKIVLLSKAERFKEECNISCKYILE